MHGLRLISSKFSLLFISAILLSGCSTIDGIFGGGMNDPANVEAVRAAEDAEQIPMEERMPMERAEPTTEELLAQKDEALIEQGMRLAAAQVNATSMREELSVLQQELEASKLETMQKQEMLDARAEEQVMADAESSRMDVPREVAPDGGYGLHLASFELQESIEPGLKFLTNRIPVLIEGKPVKLSDVTVRGRNFRRLIIGQFDSQSDAQAECTQALLLVNFCEVVAFAGEDY